MRKLDIGMISGLKIFIITLTLLVPVGIAWAIDDCSQETGEYVGLSPAQKTIELGYEPMEILSLRTAVSKTYDTGDGSKKAVIHIKPIHYLDGDDNWQEIDESKPMPGTRSREVKTATVGKDTYISTSFGAYSNEILNYGGDVDIKISRHVPPPPPDPTPGFFPFRGLLKFNIDSLSIPSDAEINSAKLKLYYYLSEGSGSDPGISTPLDIDIYPLTRDWFEGTGSWGSAIQDGVCWNNYDGTNAWTLGGDYDTSYSGSGLTPTAYGWTTDLETKVIVKAWLDGSITNNGMVLIGDENHQFLKYFRSSDYSTSSDHPKLEIDYISNHPPEVENAIYFYDIYEDSSKRYLDLEYHPIFSPDGLFSDPDDDDLEIYIHDGWEWTLTGAYESSSLIARIISTNNTLELETKPNQNGYSYILLNATDDYGGFLNEGFLVEVLEVNDPPKINDTTKWKLQDPEPTVEKGKLTCLEDQWANFTITAWDPIERGDDKLLKYSCNSTEDYASFFSIEEKTGKVSFVPLNKDVGEYYLKIIVNDTGAENYLAKYTFRLEVKNVNDKPMFTEITTPQFAQIISSDATSITISGNAIEDQYFNFTVYAEDEDLLLNNSEERITVSIMPSDRFTMKTISDTPKKIVEISFLPENADVGTFTAQLSVTDRENEDTTIELQINVANINDPPIFSVYYFGTQTLDLDPIQQQVLDLGSYGSVYEGTEGGLYTFEINAIDVDVNDEIEFDFEIQNRTKNEKKDLLAEKDTGDAGNGDEISETKEVTVMLDQRAGRFGELWINITIKDKSKDESLLILRIPVENINDPPPKSKIEVTIVDTDRNTKYVKENLTVKFEADNVTDPDGDNLIYSWDFDDSDGITEDARGYEGIDWTYPKEGTYVVTLTVDDGNGATNVSTVSIQVFKPESKEKDDEGGLALGSVGGVSVLYVVIVIVVIVIILVLLAFMMIKKKKKRAEEEAAAAAEAEQAQLMAQYNYMAQQAAAYGQDPAMMAQYQAYQQQLMQQYPEQYQQMMMQYQQQMMAQQQQYGYDSQTPLMQQLEAQPYTTDAGAGMGMEAYAQAGLQPQPVQSMALAEAQPSVGGLPGSALTDQPQLPPAADDILGGEFAPEGLQKEEPAIPESPFAQAQTQSLEEEMGTDAALAEVPIEPDTTPPEPEIAPEPEIGTEPEHEVAPEPEVEAGPEPEVTAEAEPEVAPATEAEETDAETGDAEPEKKCENCGAPVKEGWFLCPKCKQPLI